MFDGATPSSRHHSVAHLLVGGATRAPTDRLCLNNGLGETLPNGKRPFLQSKRRAGTTRSWYVLDRDLVPIPAIELHIISVSERLRHLCWESLEVSPTRPSSWLLTLSISFPYQDWRSLPRRCSSSGTPFNLLTCVASSQPILATNC